MAIHPPAFCPIHGFFPVTKLRIDGAQGLTIAGSLADCGQCGRWCEIVPGTYNALPDGLNILVDQSISDATRNVLLRLAQKVGSGEIAPEAAAIEAEKVHPKAGFLFLNWSDESKAIIAAAVIGAIGIIGAARVSKAPDTTIVVHPVIERVVREVSGLHSKKSQEEPQSGSRSELPKPNPSGKPKNGH